MDTCQNAKIPNDQVIAIENSQIVSYLKSAKWSMHQLGNEIILTRDWAPEMLPKFKVMLSMWVRWMNFYLKFIIFKSIESNRIEPNQSPNWKNQSKVIKITYFFVVFHLLIVLSLIFNFHSHLCPTVLHFTTFSPFFFYHVHVWHFSFLQDGKLPNLYTNVKSINKLQLNTRIFIAWLINHTIFMASSMCVCAYVCVFKRQ